MAIETKKVVTVSQQATVASGAKKSGIIQMKPGDILFNDGETAESLYIIQKGQLRLFKPKGKGFVEIAVLRSGEVIGEMAYFDEDGSGRKRSCSASAMVSTEVLEISFHAFGKTMDALNPWFKTIINTLASRLRKTNARVRELESNSVSGAYGAGKIEYEFFKNVDIIRCLTIVFLVVKSVGEKHPGGLAVHINTLRFYAIDIFNILDAKLDEFVTAIANQGLVTMANDKDNAPKLLVLKDIEMVRFLMVFFNTQRSLVDEKKLKISPKCEHFLEKILEEIKRLGISDTHIDLVLTPILDAAKSINRPMDLIDLTEARTAGFVGEVIVDKANVLICTISYEKLSKTMPAIRMMNAIKKFNENYAGGTK